MIRVVLFDFGGVLAEEGFREGLMEIGRSNRLDPGKFYGSAAELVYSSGYVTGKSDEAYYWNAVREETGIKGTDKEFREQILSRFVQRPLMFEFVKQLKSEGMRVAILSDQTNWLDELDQRRPFFHLFEEVFNSYKMKKGKRDSSVFHDVCKHLNARPEEILFVDDNEENIERSRKEGLQALHFTSVDAFSRELEKYLNGMQMPVPGRKE